MATTKQRTRISPENEPGSKALSGLAKTLASKAKTKTPETASAPPDEVIGDTVMTNVVTAFTLTLDDGTTRRYEVGANRMPREHAEHWYSVAHGTKIVK